MANQIKMATSASIIELYVRGWSQRRIARELGLDRGTVSRHIRLHAETAVSKPANVPAGDERDGDSKPAIPPAGAGEAATAKPAIPPAGIRGRKSQCRAYHEAILAGVEAGLTAQRIFQDLRAERGFEGAYDAVKRYVRRLSGGNAERIERMECAPGEEAQVDFGLGAPVLVDGKRRRTWVLRVVLSHSRKGYSEAMFRQGTEEFVRGLENAFRHFGGVPKTLVPDNLRAAVARPDWFDPELTPKMAAFARHYGTVVLPTRPRHPEHKGKVERGVGYVKGNALKGRVFGSLAEENAYLRQWEERVADRRVHGTTRQHVGRSFEERERPALLPLPPMPFPCFEEGLRTVHRDAFVEVRQAYYRVPEESVGRSGRVGTAASRIYNRRMEPVARTPGWSPASSARRAGPRGPGVTRTAEYWRARARQVGPWRVAGPADAALGDPRLMGLCLGRARTRQLRRLPQALRAAAMRLRHLAACWRASRARPAHLLQTHPIRDPPSTARCGRATAGVADRRACGLLAALRRDRRQLLPLREQGGQPEPTGKNMNESLRKRLRQLRLSGLASALDVRLQEAAGHNLSHLEFLELILQDEFNIRGQRKLSRRKKWADFRDARTLEDFDFSFNPSASASRSTIWLPASSSGRPATCCSSGRPASARAISPRPSATRPSRWASSCSTARSSTWCANCGRTSRSLRTSRLRATSSPTCSSSTTWASSSCRRDPASTSSRSSCAATRTAPPS